MDEDRFDDMVCAISGASRRGLTRVLIGAVLAGHLRMLAGIGEAEAKKNKKKTTLCLDGQTIQASRKKKKKLLKIGATHGACPECTPDGECGPCRECQDGRCVNKPNNTQCVATDITRRCRDGVCNAMPQCGSFTNICTSDRVCCYQNPGDPCPFNGKCEEKSADGHRCRFDADCASGNCAGYICDPA